ncbi:MAG: 2-oxoglutarate dehydrogenase E1 component [Armatimonadetes bacterium]|nr:2-oxoglutarate dehydrogenase E1 component [Armatimonadota bacterium]
MDRGEQGLNSLSLSFMEGLYEQFLTEPASVPSDWRKFFESQGNGGRTNGSVRFRPRFKPASIFNPSTPKSADSLPVSDVAVLQDRVDQLVRAYRIRGHMIAQIDPLGRPRPAQPELDLQAHGLTEADLDRTFSATTISGPETLTLREILHRLRNTYCRSIGVQFMHIDDYAVKMWLQERMESTENHLTLSTQEQLRIFSRLTDAVTFEEFIQKKFIGAKSFSLEGAESLIPLLDLAIERAGEQGVNEIVIAMAHRGRLNVLANIMSKSPRAIFREFQDLDPDVSVGHGDVKYHLGYHNDWLTECGHEVHLALCFNPSHLEFVNPVALGRVRAKQDRLADVQREKYVSILIHGDASLAGEGIVQETLNLSRLEGFSTGGTVHVVVNNQIGFTTNPSDGRSGTYATNVAQMLQVPIFHVNGEDPEAVAQVVKLSMDFRQTFKQDVFIDMYCFRRRGHNESDEPSFTQPMMYKEISSRKSVRDSYLERLLNLGGITRQQADEVESHRRAQLEEELQGVHEKEEVRLSTRPSILGRVWRNYLGGPESGVRDVDTSVDPDRLQFLLDQLTKLPQDFTPNPKIQRFLDARRAMARREHPLDWSAAETLAFGSLATEGHRVRLSGQDSERGTFSHRHAVLHDFHNGDIFTPLQHLSADQAPVEIINSPLSEAGVLGFEYGYSIAYPDGLVAWEAQFGDFWNAAQVIVDQFLVSAEDKWHSLSGLVLLLPHGFEGMGPEHSSARLERFLLSAAEDNIQIVVPSTPAQMFHVLRRQVLRPWRKPLVIMTPKSLLRHPEVISSIDDLATQSFQRVLADPVNPRPDKVERILLCSGKIFYDLQKQRRELGHEDDIAIIRLEQLYPLPETAIEEALARYADETPVFWVQEEPENMGAWRYLQVRFPNRLLGRFPFSGISRAASASPATGSANIHKIEQQAILERAFGGVFEHAPV